MSYAGLYGPLVTDVENSFPITIVYGDLSNYTVDALMKTNVLTWGVDIILDVFE